MSILVKGMKMPESCTVCKLLTGDGICKQLLHGVVQAMREGKRHENCPLIEVPPHGDLIDRDALKVQDGWLRDSKYFSQNSSHTHITFVYSNDICNAPTIIPADKEET